MKKSLCLALSVLLGSAIWTAVAPGAASASTVIEREFRYGPGRFELTRNADGTTQVGMSSATREYTAGRPDLPLVGELVEHHLLGQLFQRPAHDHRIHGHRPHRHGSDLFDDHRPQH